MNEKIKKQVEKAEGHGAYFMTITYRDDDGLKHWQFHTADFFYKDLMPTIDEIKNMIYREYPGLKYVESKCNHTGS